MKKITVALATVAVAAIAFAPVAHADCGADHAKKASHAGHDHASKDIVDTAVEAGSFKTLVAAVQAAGLVDVLKGEGPYTVFAPTDEAFAKLPEGTVEMLLKPENKDRLVEVLTYHVVKGRVYSTDALAAKRAATLGGEEITISVDAKQGAMVNRARLVATDIDASNGVIHVIDGVLIPATPKG